MPSSVWPKSEMSTILGCRIFVDRLGFLEEARHQPRIVPRSGRRHLHRHPLANHGVFRQIDRPHATFSQHADDLVVADAATDHECLVSISGLLASRARTPACLERARFGRIVFASHDHPILSSRVAALGLCWSWRNAEPPRPPQTLPATVAAPPERNPKPNRVVAKGEPQFDRPQTRQGRASRLAW